MTEDFCLENVFEAERIAIETEVKKFGEYQRVKVHCHTTINNIEKYVKEFIKRLIEEIRKDAIDDKDANGSNFAKMNYTIAIEGILNKLAGEKLTK